MKASNALLALAATIVPVSLLAQQPNTQAPQSSTSNRSSGITGASPKLPFSRTPSAASAVAGRAKSTSRTAPADPKVVPATNVVQEPTPPDELKPATIALPSDPIEPFLLTRDAGPFMVMAKTFRGPDAERFALALAIELRRDYGLPAYILRTKDFPRNSLIRNIPPNAPRDVMQPAVAEPEKVRTYDEAAVLVGNEKTEADSLNLLHKVKKIKPKCLEGMPNPFHWRAGKGLGMALRTTNPFVPAQDLYPGRKKDALIAQMNDGPRSVFNCPGRYSLQVIEFGGRATFNANDGQFLGLGSLKKSPLITAAADAERVAEAIAKDPAIVRTGMQPYVYHDRTSSRVLVGSFNRPDDPAAGALREILLREAVELSHQKKAGIMIAPAPMLTDLSEVKGTTK